MDIIDLRETHDRGLLEQVYNGLYLTCFTDPDEQEDLEQYRERLFDAQKPPPQPKTHFLVAGERLRDPQTRVIVGMMIFELYRESSCGLLTYLAVAPAGRGRGLGRTLLRRAIDILVGECAPIGGLRAVFAETHDPNRIAAAADSMSPRERIEVMKRLGAQQVPVRYVQPELRPGDGRSRKLLLITFPIKPNEPQMVSGPALLDFLNEFYRALGVSTPPEDADFQATKADVAAAETNNPRPEIVQGARQLGLDLAPVASPLESARPPSGVENSASRDVGSVVAPPLQPERPSSQSNGWILLGWWIFAIAWFVGFPYVVQFLSKQFPAVPSMKQIATWSRGDYGYFLAAHTADFVLSVFRGAVAFAILGWSYRTPLRFLIHSTFPDDERPQLSWSILWNPFAAFRRVVEMLAFYTNILSLSAVRRFLYVATHPLLSRKVLNLLPDRVYQKLQVYFEAELFRHKADDESRGAYGEAVAALYCENVKLLDRQRRPVAKCQTCFDVFGSNGKKIDRYFKAQVLVQRDPKFLTRIEFESGYLAPAYLVSGLLSEFDEDWTKIVGAYPEKMRRLTDTTDPLQMDPLHALPELRKLQSFIWDCWVQWGPSVPISGAPAWRSGEAALQYGYGDENNSLPVRLDRAATNAASIRTDTSPGDWNGFHFDNWSKFITALLAGGLEPTASAWPVKVSGHLRWLMSRERNARFCPAQQTTKPGVDGWLVLDADSIEPDPAGPKFYSAYVWVLIAICDSRPPSASASTSSSADGSPTLPPNARPYRLIEVDSKNHWRCLIPFFQHGNIAEPSVYESIKRELADKTITNLLAELARAEKAGIDWLHFAFVAAYDDNGDADQSTTLVPPSSDTILDYMVAALHSRTDRDPAAKALATRIHCAPDAFPQLAASELPHVVRAYLDHIEELTTKK